MTNHKIDNSAREIKKSVLWQYDKSYNLLLVFQILNDYFTAAVERFWDSWRDDVLGIDTCNEFGASVWGALLGVKRPSVLGPDEYGLETVRPVDLPTYRKILKAAFFFMNSTSSISDIVRYAEILFTPDGDDAKCGVSVVTNNELDLSYVKNENFDAMPYDMRAVYEQLGDEYFIFPLGIRQNTAVPEVLFGFQGQERLNPNTRGARYHVFGTPATCRKGDFLLYEHPDKGPLIFVFRERTDITEETNFADIEGVLSAYLEGSDLTEEWMADYPKIRAYGGFCADETNDEYDIDKPYARNAFVKHGGKTYLCVADVPAAINTGWEAVASNFAETFSSVCLSYDSTTIDSQYWIEGFPE